MARLTLSTTMTVDGVITVAEWFVSGGEHDEAAHELLARSAGMVLGRKTYAGLVDEAWFWVHPAIWGEGERPLGGDDVKLRMELVGVESFDSGVALLRYRP